MDLIKPIIPFVNRVYRTDKLMEFIQAKIESNTKNALVLLNDFFKQEETPINIHPMMDEIKEILTKATNRKDDAAIADLINEAVNRLGEMGFYEYKTFLISE